MRGYLILWVFWKPALRGMVLIMSELLFIGVLLTILIRTTIAVGMGELEHYHLWHHYTILSMVTLVQLLQNP